MLGLLFTLVEATSTLRFLVKCSLVPKSMEGLQCLSWRGGGEASRWSLVAGVRARLSLVAGPQQIASTRSARTHGSRRHMMLLHLSDDELGHICKRLDLLSGLGLASTAKGVLGQTRRLQLRGSADEAAKTIQRAFRRQYLALVEVRRVGAPEGEAWMPHCDFRTAAEVYGVHPSVVSLVLNPMNPPQLQTNGWG